ncbi:hypothetical protein [Flavobacterium sp.]|uniref:hypothetical protein n=1 Tax=Flavobacterium sp. TaxID=239 RepID=UPI0035284215
MQKIEFDYISNPHAEDDFLLMNFSFTNALYFRINRTNYLYDGKKIIYLKPHNHKIDFEAIGLFKNYKKQIEIDPSLKTNFSNFKIKSQELNLGYNHHSDLQIINLQRTFDLKNSNVKFEIVKLKRQNITLKLDKFNQNNYL